MPIRPPVPAAIPASDRLAGRNLLIEHHLWVVALARQRLSRRLPRSVDPDLLTSDGQLALLRAAERFDPRRGVPFRIYALQRVLFGMIDGLRRCQRRSRLLPAQTAKRPDEVAVEDEAYCTVDRADELASLLRRIPSRRADVVRLFYLEQLSQRQIAQKLRITEARVSQLLRSAGEELRARSVYRRAA